MRTEELLRQSQALTPELRARSEELQSQQEELKRANRELEHQAQTLRASEELLQQQQEELQQTNEELEEKAQLLEEQNARIETRRASALQDRRPSSSRSPRATRASSSRTCRHELRTPLNSLLILAKLLADNADGNLTEKQIEFAAHDPQAGTDLLGLINDILDLSKVEAGKMDVHLADVPLLAVAERVEQTFRAARRAEGARVLELESPRALPGAIPPTSSGSSRC